MAVTKAGTHAHQLKKLSQGKIELVEPDRDHSKYRQSTTQHGVKGTLLPFSDRFGGIEGSQSVFGMIVPGKVMSLDEHGNAVSKGTFVIYPGKDRQMLEQLPEKKLNTKAPEGVDAAAYEQMRKIAEGVDVVEGEELEEEPTRQIMDFEERPPTAEIPAPRLPRQRLPVPEPAAELIRVKITSESGSFSGRYQDVVLSNGLLILYHDIEADIYTPKADPDHTLTIQWADQRVTAYFVGVQYELPKLKRGFQVFIPAENQ